MFSFGQQSQPQGQQQQSSPFSFGQSPAASQPAASTPSFSFGTPASAAQPSTSLFGAKPATSTPSLFGAPAAASSAPAFGSTPAASASTGLFGSTAPAQPATGLFGAASTQSSQPQAGNSSFSFSGFGAPQSQAQPSTGLFGSQPAQQKPAGSSLFSFGQPQQQQQQPQQSTSMFGSAFGAPQQQQQPQQPQPSLSQSILAPPATDSPADLAAKIQSIQAAWDPSNPAACAFKTYVYNIMDAQTSQWIKSQGGGQAPRMAQDVDEELWSKAVKENPDREKLLPSLLVGHDVLNERVRLQDEMASKHAVKLEEFATQLRQLNSKHTLETSLRLQRAKHAQAVLSARLIHLVARLNQLTPTRGSPMRAEEESLQSTLHALVRQMGGRGSELERGSSMQDRINELWVLIAQKKARKGAAIGNGSSGGQNAGEWAVANEAEAVKVLQVLAQQHRTLEYLTQVVQNDAKVVDVIKQGFGEAPVSNSLGQSK